MRVNVQRQSLVYGVFGGYIVSHTRTVADGTLKLQLFQVNISVPDRARRLQHSRIHLNIRSAHDTGVILHCDDEDWFKATTRFIP